MGVRFVSRDPIHGHRSLKNDCSPCSYPIPPHIGLGYVDVRESEAHEWTVEAGSISPFTVFDKLQKGVFDVSQWIGDMVK